MFTVAQPRTAGARNVIDGAPAVLAHRTIGQSRLASLLGAFDLPYYHFGASKPRAGLANK